LLYTQRAARLRLLRRCCLAQVLFFQAGDGIRDFHVTGVQTCALPISLRNGATSPLRAVAANRRHRDRTRRARSERAASADRGGRSEERRVGKECRSRWSAAAAKRKRMASKL